MRRLVALVLAALSSAALAASDPVRFPPVTWDVAALSAAPRSWPVEEPCSNVTGRVAGVLPVWVEGEPYQDRPTRVFAWWGLPAGASATKKVPAMVLVHGGGGTAFASWVKRWTDRGYAAIAMDTCGKIPQGERDGKPHPAHAWSGPPGWEASVAQMKGPAGDRWLYHAVAAILRCHSFLAARPEVDAARTGITGISWGGYLTSIVMGVDHRFKFAAPVYGCGFYWLNPKTWRFGSATPELRQAWFDRCDASQFIGGVTCPVLWCDGNVDRFYTPEMLRRSCALVKSPLALALRDRMPHGHPPAGDPKEIAVFADHYLKGAPPPPVVSATRKGSALAVTYDGRGRTVAKAEFLFTSDHADEPWKRAWQVRPVPLTSPAAGTFEVAVPDGAWLCFANIVTADGLVLSTPIFEAGE